MDKPQIIEHINKNVNFTLFDAKWIPCSAKVVVLGSHAKGSGALQIYELCGNDLKLVLESEKGKPMKCGTFGATTLNERNLATGDFDGRLSIWDLERIDDPIYTVKAHSQIVNCIDGVGGLGIGKGAPEIVTGSRDGSVKVWDPRQKDVPVVAIEPESTRNDCWTVAFGHSHCQAERSICVGYNNGDVKLFDLRVMKARWETTLSHGVCCLEFDRKDIPMNKLVACTLESGIHLFDMRTKHPRKGYAQLSKQAHKSTVWAVRHLPQDRDIFMTTGGSGSLCLWKYNYPDKRSKEDEDGVDEGCVGTLTCLQETTLCQQPLSSMDWSPDKSGLAICTAFDQTIRLLIVTKLNRT